jgi:hypothetical protein
LVRDDWRREACPPAHCFATFFGQIRKSQSGGLLRLIRPYQVALNLDSTIMLPEPETDCLNALNGSNRMKAKTTFRNIQHTAAIAGLNIDVGESFRGLPWS